MGLFLVSCKAKEYTVTFQDLEGNIITKEIWSKEKKDNLPGAPDVLGYNFVKWNNELVEVNQDLIVKPIYEAIVYDIQYELSGGSNNASNKTQYTIESEDILLLDPSKDGYYFIEWQDNNQNKIVKIEKGSTGLKVLTARFEKLNRVTYLSASKEVLTDTLVQNSETVVPPTHPNINGYTFDYWEKNYDEANKHLTYQAVLKTVNYEIKYDLDGGTNHENNPSSYTIETKIVLNEPTKNGYQFVGWYNTANERVTSIEKGFFGELFLRAEWQKLLKITFLGKDKTVIQVVDIALGEAIIAPKAPLITGYTFIDWDKQLGNASEDLIVQALYTPTLYTITYDLDGGINHESNPDTYTIETETFRLLEPTKENYQFLGWYNESNEKIENIKKTETGNLHLIAHYTDADIFDVRYIHEKETSKNLKSYFPFFAIDEEILILQKDTLYSLKLNFPEINVANTAFVPVFTGHAMESHGLYISAYAKDILVVFGLENIYITVFNEKTRIEYINVFERVMHVYANGYKDFYTVNLTEASEDLSVIKENNLGFTQGLLAVKQTKEFNLSEPELFDQDRIKGNKMIITTKNNVYYDTKIFRSNDESKRFTRNLDSHMQSMLLEDTRGIQIGNQFDFVYNKNQIKFSFYDEIEQVTLKLHIEDYIVHIYDFGDYQFIQTKENHLFLYLIKNRQIIEFALPQNIKIKSIGELGRDESGYLFILTEDNQMYTVAATEILNMEKNVIVFKKESVAMYGQEIVDFYYINSDHYYYVLGEGNVITVDKLILSSFVTTEYEKILVGEEYVLWNPQKGQTLYTFSHWTNSSGKRIDVLEQVDSKKVTALDLYGNYKKEINIHYKENDTTLTITKRVMGSEMSYSSLIEYIRNIYEFEPSNSFDLYSDASFKEKINERNVYSLDEIYVKSVRNILVSVDDEYIEFTTDEVLNKENLIEKMKDEYKHLIVTFYEENNYYEPFDFSNIKENWIRLNALYKKDVELIYEEKSVVKTITFMKNQESVFNELDRMTKEFFKEQGIVNETDYIGLDAKDQVLSIEDFMMIYDLSLIKIIHMADLKKVYLDGMPIILVLKDDKYVLPEQANPSFYAYITNDKTIYLPGATVEPEMEFNAYYQVTVKLIESGELIKEEKIQFEGEFYHELSNKTQSYERDYYILKTDYNEKLTEVTLDVYSKETYREISVVLNKFSLSVFIKRTDTINSIYPWIINFDVIGFVDENNDKVIELSEEIETLYAIYKYDFEIVLSDDSVIKLEGFEFTEYDYEEKIKDIIEARGLVILEDIYLFDIFSGKLYLRTIDRNLYYIITIIDDKDSKKFIEIKKTEPILPEASRFYTKDENGNYILFDQERRIESDLTLYDLRYSFQTEVMIRNFDKSLSISSDYLLEKYYIERELYYALNGNYSVLAYYDKNGNTLSINDIKNNRYSQIIIEVLLQDEYLEVYFENVGYRYFKKDENDYAVISELMTYEGKFFDSFIGWYDEEGKKYLGGEDIYNSLQLKPRFSSNLNLHYLGQVISINDLIFNHNTYEDAVMEKMREVIDNMDSNYYYGGIFADSDYEIPLEKLIKAETDLYAKLISKELYVRITVQSSTESIFFLKKTDPVSTLLDYVYEEGLKVVGFIDDGVILPLDSVFTKDSIVYALLEKETYKVWFDDSSEMILENFRFSFPILEYDLLNSLDLGTYEYYIEHCDFESARVRRKLSPSNTFTIHIINQNEYIYVSVDDPYLREDLYFFQRSVNGTWIHFDTRNYKITSHLRLYTLAVNVKVRLEGLDYEEDFLFDRPSEATYQHIYDRFKNRGFIIDDLINNGVNLGKNEIFLGHFDVVLTATGESVENYIEVVLVSGNFHESIFLRKDENQKAVLPEIAYKGLFESIFSHWIFEDQTIAHKGAIIESRIYIYPVFSITLATNIESLNEKMEFRYFYEIEQRIIEKLRETMYFVGLFIDEEFKTSLTEENLTEQIYVEAYDMTLYDVITVSDNYQMLYLKKGDKLESLLKTYEGYEIIGFIDNNQNVIDLERTFTEDLERVYAIYRFEKLHVTIGRELNKEFTLRNIVIHHFNFYEIIESNTLNEMYNYSYERRLSDVINELSIYANAYSSKDHKIVTIYSKDGYSNQVIINQWNEYLNYSGIFFTRDESGNYEYFNKNIKITKNLTIYEKSIMIYVHEQEQTSVYPSGGSDFSDMMQRIKEEHGKEVLYDNQGKVLSEYNLEIINLELHIYIS